MIRICCNYMCLDHAFIYNFSETIVLPFFRACCFLVFFRMQNSPPLQFDNRWSRFRESVSPSTLPKSYIYLSRIFKGIVIFLFFVCSPKTTEFALIRHPNIFAGNRFTFASFIFHQQASELLRNRSV